jgi:predicted  nucleic acid-binding Zn-ribbon protein
VTFTSDAEPHSSRATRFLTVLFSKSGILMANELNARVDRLEESERRAWAAIEALSDKQEKLDDVLVVIAEAHAKLAESHVKLAEAQLETEKRFQQTDERSRQIDERIDKLVSAIGELIRRQSDH